MVCEASDDVTEGEDSLPGSTAKIFISWSPQICYVVHTLYRLGGRKEEESRGWWNMKDLLRWPTHTTCLIRTGGVCGLRVCVLSCPQVCVWHVTHPEALESETGAMLDLNVWAFQTFCVVNQCLEEGRRGHACKWWNISTALYLCFNSAL